MLKFRKTSVAENAVLNTVKTVIGIVFPLLIYPYISRVLGAEQLGVYDFSHSIYSYVRLVSMLGISIYAVREGSFLREDKEKIEEFANEVFSINIISTLIGYLLLFVILLSPAMGHYRITTMILCTEVLFFTVGAMWVFSIYEDYLYITLRSILVQCFSLVLIFLFVKTPADVNKYAAVRMFAHSLSFMIGYFYICRRYCRIRFVWHMNWKKHLKPILIIFSTTIAVSLYVNFDTTAIGLLLNDYQVGLYGMAVRLYIVIKDILTAVVIVLIPRFSILFSEGKKEEASKVLSRVLGILMMLMLPMCMGVFILSSEIVQIIAGAEFAGAAFPLRLMSCAIAFSIYSYTFIQCILIPQKKEKIVFYTTLFSLAVNIVLDLLLIPVWGIAAAAVTTIIAEGITLLICLFHAKRSVHLYMDIRNIFSVLAGCIGIVAICLLCKKMSTPVMRVALSVLFSVPAYFSMLYILKNDTLKDLYRLFRK
ncbi:MAG: oligosaccharide flippase family protein [Solobacterium sp.]|nr:oligosaccharide flippase family protein [Solobacterium sp.]